MGGYCGESSMRAVIKAAIALVGSTLLMSGSAIPTWAGARVALLIGNSAYSPRVGRLANPQHDVVLLELALKMLQFDVVTVRDVGLADLTRAVNGHVRRTRAAGPNAISFVYYSGHGAANSATGVNYLIPIDVKSAKDEEIWDASMRLSDITRRLRSEASNATHFVVFDACQNELKYSQGGSKALIKAKGFLPDREEGGMLIAYATAEGQLASDAGDRAGPYARALAEEILKPGVEAVTMFRRVQLRVRATIGQDPWLNYGTLGELYLAGPPPTETPQLVVGTTERARRHEPSSPVSQQSSPAARAWEDTKDSKNPLILEEFILAFGDTPYGVLARKRLDEIKNREEIASREKSTARVAVAVATAPSSSGPAAASAPMSSSSPAPASAPAPSAPAQKSTPTPGVPRVDSLPADTKSSCGPSSCFRQWPSSIWLAGPGEYNCRLWKASGWHQQ